MFRLIYDFVKILKNIYLTNTRNILAKHFEGILSKRRQIYNSLCTHTNSTRSGGIV